MKAVADEDMTKRALGEEYDELREPPNAEVPREHKLWPQMLAAIREVYDPEIPVNIYELGLLYKVVITPVESGEGEDPADEREGEDGDLFDIFVEMTLTSPGCPVAQEMPGWVQGAFFPIEGVREVDVEIVWEPPWDPSMMAETAKLQLNMFT